VVAVRRLKALAVEEAELVEVWKPSTSVLPPMPAAALPALGLAAAAVWEETQARVAGMS
jgi:hypothetical protein